MNDINVKLVATKPAADLDPLFQVIIKKNGDEPSTIEAPSSVEESISSNDAVEPVGVADELSYEVISLNDAKDECMDVDESPKEVHIPIVVEIAEEEDIDDNDAVSNAVAALTGDNTVSPQLNGDKSTTLETEELLNVLETKPLDTAQEETKSDESLQNNEQNTSHNIIDNKDDIPKAVESKLNVTDFDSTDTTIIEIVPQPNAVTVTETEIKPDITISVLTSDVEVMEDNEDLIADLEKTVPVLESEVLESKVLDSKVLESKLLESKVLESKVLDSKALDSKVLGSKVLEPEVILLEKVVPKEPELSQKDDPVITEQQNKNVISIESTPIVNTNNKAESPITKQLNSKSPSPNFDTKTSIDLLISNIKVENTRKLNEKRNEILSLVDKTDSIITFETEAVAKQPIINTTSVETEEITINPIIKAVDEKSSSPIQNSPLEVNPDDKGSLTDKDTDTEMVDAVIQKEDKKGTIKVVKPEALGQTVNGDVSKEEHSIKRRPSDDIETESPLKKLCQEVEKTFPQHDTMINEYIQTATKNNIDEIQKHTEQLLAEIQTLRELAQKKEHEWNNILHLKKVKEEILLRLLRRKQVISFEKSPEVNGSSSDRKDPFEYLNQAKNLAIDKSDEISGLALRQPIAASPPINPGSMNQNSMNQGPMNQGSMNQGSLNQGSMNQGPMNQGSMIQPPMMPGHFNTMTGLPPPYDKVPMQGMPNMQNMPKNMFPQSLMMPGPTMQGFPRDMNINGGMPQNYMPMGRQGPTKDVKSIIADYRQRNPDVTPRRGRRLKSLLNPNMMNAQGPRQIAPKLDNLGNLGMIFNNLDMNQKAMLERLSQMQGANLPNGMSFKDVLVQFASMQQQGMMPLRPDMMPGRVDQPCRMEPPSRPEPPPTRPDPPRPSGRRPERTPQQHHEEVQISMKSERVASSSPRLPPPPPYPEISLLPVNQETPGSNTPQNSLLHGILTKNCGEITITPVQPAAAAAAPEVTPQEKQEEIVQLDDEESPASEGSTEEVSTGSGRLVIDEASGEAETPLCQGCRRRDAQFVCAGCANQWYCSRDCQVAAWDEHSEMCSG